MMMMTTTQPQASSVSVDEYVHKVTAEAAVYPPIETWVNAHAQRDYVIKIDVHEFTSVCPKTGLPDFGKITIEYIPDALVIELKAFKYYMLAYRNVGMFYENITNKVLTDIVDAINPRWVKVHSDFSTRGGISTEALCVYQQEGYHKPAYLG